MGDDLRTPGWDAINSALEPIYKGQTPLHWGTAVPYALGGPDPIQGISTYKRIDPDHWHFVTFGFTELYEKENEDRSKSGYGFELTLRVVRSEHEDRPPGWAFGFFQNLGRYVFKTGNTFGVGHHMPLNGPICQGSDTAIRAIAFLRDPELGDFIGENGHAEFLQIVGITEDELDLIKSWNAESFLTEMAKLSPLLLTDLKRKSVLADSAKAAALQGKADAEGSSSGYSHIDEGRLIAGRPMIWEVGALYVDSIRRGLKGRIPFARPFHLCGRERTIHMLPGEPVAVTTTDNALTLTLSPAVAAEMLSTLQPRRGDYRWGKLPDLVIRVVPTEIKGDGDKVVDVIG